MRGHGNVDAMGLNPYQPPASTLKGGSGTVEEPDDLLPPSLWARWLASLIDSLLLIVPLTVLVGAVLIAVQHQRALSSLELETVFALALQPVLLGAQVLYFGLMEASSGQASVGKRLLGLQVVDDQGRRLTTRASMIRSGTKALSLFFCGLLAATVLFDPRRQRGAWDHVAGTRVVLRRYRKTAE